MTRRWRIVATSIGVGIGAGLVLQLMRSAEPQYQGRSISAWLDDMAGRKGSDYQGAIREIGTNTLPYAIAMLARKDSNWRSNCHQLHSKLPQVLRKILPEPKPTLQVVDGANVFFYVGSNSIPNAIALLKHPSPQVRQAAARGLGALRRQSAAANQAIPALIEALADPDRDVRFSGVLALKQMGADASNAVPAITSIVAETGVGPPTNSFLYLRAAAASTLGKIGPVAADALPELKAALREPNSYLRGQAAVAIWRIDADVDTALPVLLEEIPRAMISEESKKDWIIALGEMGSRAKAALPQLKYELRRYNHTSGGEHISNALIRIDPAAVPDAGR